MYRIAMIALLPACAATPPSEPPAPPPPVAPINVDDCYAPDCPYVGVNVFPMYDDAVTEQIIPLALHGAYDFGWETYSAQSGRTTAVASGGFIMIDDAPESTRVRGAVAGVGTLTVTAYVPYHDTEVYAATPEDLEILPVDEVGFDLPRYVPEGAPIAPVVATGAATFAVRLLAGGREVADETLAGTFGSQTSWDAFALEGLAVGHYTTTITADSLDGPATIGFDVIAGEDEIRTSDVHEPGNTYYHLVCAHAFVADSEVYTTWTMSAANANGWIPATAGNCLEVVPLAASTTVTFTAADARTVTVAVTP